MGFGDASLRAYAAVVHLQVEIEGRSHCQLLCSKARVAPVEKLTIPLLELLSALILARLIDQVSEAMKTVLSLEPPVCYLDSKVAYYWISGQDRSWKPFVQNRVVEIRKRVPAARWRHCSGELNPANTPSRGQNMSEFRNNTLCLSGPKISHEGLKSEELMEMPQECLSEMRKETTKPQTFSDRQRAVSNLLEPPSEHTLIETSESEGVGIEQLIHLDKHSDLECLLRITANLLVAAARFEQEDAEASPAVGWLNRAERMWVRSAQVLLEHEAKYPMWKTQFNLFIDKHGLLRCKGRLKNSALHISHLISPCCCHRVID